MEVTNIRNQLNLMVNQVNNIDTLKTKKKKKKFIIDTDPTSSVVEAQVKTID